ncbi:hypothetical protein KKG90_05230, partial [Candidatus Bipolaricaulota bacterium]|nr:hypothetical protein [Candidatus Bipolaricaulota bacterium]
EHIVARARRNGQQYEARETIIPRTSPGGDLCVAPDESFLVITVYNQPKGGTRTGSLHASFRNPDETWTAPQDLGLAVNAETTEYCPTISADGKWLFFCHLHREDGVVRAHARWIDTHVIGRLRA